MSVACSAERLSSTDSFFERSSASSSVSSESCLLRRDSMVSLPLAAWLTMKLVSMNSDMRKVTTSSRVESMSTKPGQ